MNKKILAASVAGAVLVAAGAGFAAYKFNWLKTKPPKNKLNIDLQVPDALITSNSLSRLPADLLKVPLAKDLLAEEFLFFYEQQESTLSLKGSIRRIAYEHELHWTDKMIRMMLDEPAQIAFWRGDDGALKYFALSANRGTVATLVAEAAKLKFKDKALTKAGEISVGGSTVDLYALAYAGNRNLLIASKGTRVVVLSEAAMALEPEGGIDDRAKEVLKKLLSADASDNAIHRNEFSLADNTSDHSIAVRTHFLSFGYQKFFPGARALRFDFSAKGWDTSALLDGAALAPTSMDTTALLKVLPHNPSACAMLPVQWPALGSILNGWTDQIKLAANNVGAQLDGPGAVCWYNQSRLHTPVFVAKIKNGAASDADLQLLFDGTVRKPNGAGPTQKQTSGDESRWANVAKSEVGTPTGQYNMMLARSGNTVVFSPDAQLVEKTLTVIKQRQPALGDSLPATPGMLAYVSPASLAGLARKEINASLPKQDEALLRSAADKHLAPRLGAMAKHPNYKLVLASKPPSSLGWVPVTWQPIAGAAATAPAPTTEQ